MGPLLRFVSSASGKPPGAQLYQQQRNQANQRFIGQKLRKQRLDPLFLPCAHIKAHNGDAAGGHSWMISALALESDSMRSRGSLLRGRTAFSIYRFDNRDRAFVIGLFACITLTVMGVILGASKMWYNPRIIWRPLNGIGVVAAIGYLVLCLMPMGLEIWTEYRFGRKRKI